VLPNSGVRRRRRASETESEGLSVIKTLLLFPPQGDPFQPYSSLPALAGFLRSKGRDVELRDLNIECHHYYTSPGRLSKACAAARARLDELEKRPALGHSDQREYIRLSKAVLFGPSVVERINWAKGVLRSQDDFYDLLSYSKALDVFEKALELVSAEHHPAKLSHVSFECSYSPDSVLDILSATRDKRQNPYIEFYSNVFVPDLKKQAPDVVGISITYRHQIIPGFTLAKAIKGALPGAKVVIGGSIMSSLADKLPSCPGLFSLADYFVLYEGEQALLGLLECLERGGDLSQVPNLLYMEGGEVKRSRPFVIEDLNSLPTPDLDGLPMDMYLSPRPVMLLPISRGCYWRKCTFCTVSAATNKRYRQRRIDLVVEDIAELEEKYGSPYFFFSVDVMPAKALKRLSEALIERGVKCYWQLEVRLDPAFDYDLCDLMARAGCRNLMFGMESANQRILDLMQKGTRAEHFASILRNCNSAGIATTLFCITGFPSETVEEAEDTLDFVLRNKDVITSATFSTFLLNEGSPVQRNPERYSITEVHKTERDLRKDYRYKVSSGQTMIEADRTRELIDETLDGEFPLRPYFTGLHPHVLIHLVHFGDPKFASRLRERTGVPEGGAVAENALLVRTPSLECRTFLFDWRDLESRLDAAGERLEFLLLEEGLSLKEAEALLDRSVTPMRQRFVRVVYNPETGRYHFVSAGAWRMLNLFNGGRRVADVLACMKPEDRGKGLDFIRRVHAAGMLSRPRGGDKAAEEGHGVRPTSVIYRARA